MTGALAELVAKSEIVDVINTLFVATDARDWDTVAGCFGPAVVFDMSSLGAGPATTLSPGAIVSGWRDGLAPIQAVHHQVGNHRVAVSGSAATASCYGVAYHYRPNPTGSNTRTFVGSYDFELSRDGGGRWRITLFRFNLKFIDGNLELEKA
jgi:hypothetical protein